MPPPPPRQTRFPLASACLRAASAAGWLAEPSGVARPRGRPLCQQQEGFPLPVTQTLCCFGGWVLLAFCAVFTRIRGQTQGTHRLLSTGHVPGLPGSLGLGSKGLWRSRQLLRVSLLGNEGRLPVWGPASGKSEGT